MTILALAMPFRLHTQPAPEIWKYPGEMIIIPAGEFIMGNNKGSWEEQPEHKLYLPDYQIGKHEVTRGEYRKFMEAGGYNDPKYWSVEGWIWRQGNIVVHAGMYGQVNYAERADCLSEGRLRITGMKSRNGRDMGTVIRDSGKPMSIR